MNDIEILNLIKLAIEKKGSNPRLSIVGLLEQENINSSEFWLSAAEELIKLNHAFEALDCYKNARKYEGPDDRLDLEEWADYFFTVGPLSEAENIYKELERWDMVATIQMIENKPGGVILNTIEKALENDLSFPYDSYVMVNIKKLAADFPGDQLDRLFDLGQLYLFEENYSKALEVWSKALKKDPENYDQILNEAIYCLNWHSLDNRKIPEDKIYPS